MVEQVDVPIKPAATVMLLRDAANGVEVFMLRRTHNAVFAAAQGLGLGKKRSLTCKN